MLKENDIDQECVALCDAINKYPGIRTVESCCGHDKTPYRIWFRIDGLGLTTLPALLYWFDGCHCGFCDWTVTVSTDCGMSLPTFEIKGPVGAFSQAEAIARLINDFVDDGLDDFMNDAR